MSNSSKNNKNNFLNYKNNENNNNKCPVKYLKTTLINNNNKEIINSLNLCFNNDKNINKYFFKDSDNSPSKNIHKITEIDNNNPEIVENFNKKILNQIQKKYLTPQEYSKTVYFKIILYWFNYTKNYFNILLSIKGEIIPVHKVVLISASNTLNL